MSAQIIDGRAIAAQVYSELTTRVAVLKAKGVIPRVAIIHVGTEEMTKRYVTLKENAAIRLGMECVTYHLVEDVSQQRVIELVQKLNADESVHGILVQMPLPDSMDTKTVLDAIDPEKDIDGLHFCNAGKLLNGEPAVIACTPRAVIRILDETGIDIMSKHTVVVGKSVLVGRPIAICLLNRNATVSVCHTKTQNLGDITKNADILIVAAGSAVEYSNDEYTATVPVTFEKEDAEFIYVFDKNLTPTSLSVDVKYSFATTMKNAALNTVMGLGTVFVILIMLIFLISLFQFIPGSGAQEAKAKKKAAEEAAAAPTPATVAADPVQESDNSELIAVIAAAIAASEGTSTDGFVVRSIRKINRKKR